MEAYESDLPETGDVIEEDLNNDWSKESLDESLDEQDKEVE